MSEELLKRIEINPKVMLGKPVVRHTRITVELILNKLADNILPSDILKDYPQLIEADIRAALLYAAKSMSAEELLFIP